MELHESFYPLPPEKPGGDGGSSKAGTTIAGGTNPLASIEMSNPPFTVAEPLPVLVAVKETDFWIEVYVLTPFFGENSTPAPPPPVNEADTVPDPPKPLITAPFAQGRA